MPRAHESRDHKDAQVATATAAAPAATRAAASPPGVVPPFIAETPTVTDASAVLFLDIDGVLNVTLGAGGSFSELHDSLVVRLAGVLHHTKANAQAKVVLSSSWRHDRERMRVLQRVWRRVATPLRLAPLDETTPTVSLSAVQDPLQCAAEGDPAARQRMQEIRSWLHEHDSARRGLRQWVAVDDLFLAEAAPPHMDRARHFVRTDPRHGLSLGGAQALQTLLSATSRVRDGASPLADTTEDVAAVNPSRELQDRADLVVVLAPSVEARVVVVDTADFQVAAVLDPAHRGLRRWLVDHASDVALHRIVGLQLGPDKKTSMINSGESEESSACDEAMAAVLQLPLPLPSPLQWLQSEATSSSSPSPLETWTAHMADAWAVVNHSRSLSESVTAEMRAMAVQLATQLVDTCAAHERTCFSAAMAQRQLHRAGLSEAMAARVAEDQPLAIRLLAVLPLLDRDLTAPPHEQQQQLQRLELAFDVCRVFPEKEARRLRRWLVEAIARRELTARSHLQGVRLLVSTNGGAAACSCHELDEILTTL